MLKKLLISIALLFASAAFAAVDVNQASEAELNGIHGIGPGLSERILAERDKGEFKDWADLIERVKGIGDGNAAKLSTAGLTVNGSSFSGAPAAATKPATKTASKEDKMKPAKEVASKEDKMKPAKDTASKAEKAKPAKEAASKAEKTKAAKDTASKAK
mgnify:CR=1 FL=1